MNVLSNKDIEEPSVQDDITDGFREKLRFAWKIRAVAWSTLGLNALIYMIYESKKIFRVGLIIGIVLVLVAFVYKVINRLYTCPYCGGFILSSRCTSCGKIWVEKINWEHR